MDPLIYDYLKHPFCSYNKKYLLSEYFPLLGKIISRVSPNLYRLYLNTLTRKINIKELLNIPAEIIPLNNNYDLVTMINVIEHCYDAEQVFQNILKTTKEGSYFIFSDKFYNNEQTINDLKFGYDAAHPLKVDRKVIETFLYDNFEIIYKRIQTNSMILEGEKFLWDDIYFVGKKK